MYMSYREKAEKKGAQAAAPKRIIFYRGQFSLYSKYIRTNFILRWSLRRAV
jgi:hypothetical protein